MKESWSYNLLKPFTRKISIKLALIIGLLVGSLIALTGFVLTHIAQEVLRENARESQCEIARRAAGEVALFVSRPVDLLTVAAQLTGRTRLTAADQETVLVEMSLNYPMFREIRSIDARGNEIASSNPGRPVKNWAGDPAFEAALKGKKYFSQVATAGDHLPFFRVALPYWQTGSIAGVLLAEVNLRGIWDIVDRIHFGKTGISFLITKDGLIVAHPNRKFVFRNVNVRQHAGLRRLIIEGGKTTEFRAKNGRDYLAAYQPVDAAIPLGIIVQMESAEAYALVSRMKTLILVVFCFSLAAAGLVSLFLSRRLVRPVKALQRWSKKIALGDFDYYLMPRSSDELGRLFIMFKRMSDRLKAARERERLAALGEVATSISHKLKNSIVSLKTFSQILPQRRQNEMFMQRFEHKFSSTVENLEKIFVSLSQMTTSHSLHREGLDLGLILHSLKDQYEEIMEDRRINFQLEADELPHLLGNREQLTELFSNLIQNAMQAMTDGGTLTVKIFNEPDDSRIRVTFADTGHGIAAEYVKNVFKPFFTTKHGGMGLGLPISKKIVEDHQGSLTLIHHDERGCLFQIIFPVLNSAEIENLSLYGR